eukprot:scaffold2934_cov176-Amphora_coffeaeformis.AAC.13
MDFEGKVVGGTKLLREREGGQKKRWRSPPILAVAEMTSHPRIKSDKKTDDRLTDDIEISTTKKKSDTKISVPHPFCIDCVF